MIKGILVGGTLVGFLLWHQDLLPSWETQKPLKVEISRLNAWPDQFLNDRLEVKGSVAGRISALGFSAFVLEDADGISIDVVGFRDAPEPGEEIKVMGVVRMLPLPSGGSLPVLIVK
jgi:hypothetical protein